MTKNRTLLRSFSSWVPIEILGWATLYGLMTPLHAAPKHEPWWDNCAVFIQGNDAEQAKRVHAEVVMSGAADDPAWGTFSQRDRVVSQRSNTALLHQQGMKVISYIEGFGETAAFVAELKRNSSGSWEKSNEDPVSNRLFHNFWNWEHYDGAGEIRWIGLADYFQNSDIVAPWTRTHPRYGCPMLTYPDGRPAEGQTDPNDARTNHVYDAGCSKDINGHLNFAYLYTPHLPVAGLLKTEGTTSKTPDPGYTPEEWEQMKEGRYAGFFSAGKDSACPIWIDYAKASVRQQLDAGIDGLWVDNYSPWDSLSARPILRGFGEWSVAGFRDYLRVHFTPTRLKSIGVADCGRFDIRDYFKDVCAKWGGDATNLQDPKWLDTRWSDDPLWRAYLIYKRQTGTKTLSSFYNTIKAEAALSGKPDFLVAGNDIPGFSLGWVRGDLDMVSTELSPGWGLTAGPRGYMLPPFGSYVPVYQLAREHAKGSYVNAWLYVPPNEVGMPNMARVLYAQALAFDATAMPFYNPASRTAGSEATDAAFFSFEREVSPIFKGRIPVAEVGLYYSSSSQLTELLPGGFRNHDDQPHSFAFYGWGAALTFLHTPWQAVPEWKLNLLRDLRVLVISSSVVFPNEDVPALLQWVRNGGSLIIAGTCGTHFGESGNFDPVGFPGSTLKPLIAPHPFDESHKSYAFGKGLVTWLPVDPGIAFYRAASERPNLLPNFSEILKTSVGGNAVSILDASKVDWKTGINLHRAAKQVFVDIYNTDIDPQTDMVTPTRPVTFSVLLPAEWDAKRLRTRALSLEGPGTVSTRLLNAHRLEVTVEPILAYTTVIIEYAAEAIP